MNSYKPTPQTTEVTGKGCFSSSNSSSTSTLASAAVMAAAHTMNTSNGTIAPLQLHRHPNMIINTQNTPPSQDKTMGDFFSTEKLSRNATSSSLTSLSLPFPTSKDTKLSWSYGVRHPMAAELSTCRRQVALLNKMALACLADSQREEALQSLALGLMELQKYEATSGTVLKKKHHVKIQAWLKQWSSCAKAMEVEEEAEPNRSLYIYQRENYDEGMAMYQEPLEVTADQSRSDMEATLLYNLGQVALLTDSLSKAQTLWEAALNTAQDAKTVYFLLHNLGFAAYQLGRNDTAVQYYERALRQAQEDNMTSLDLAASYNCVAVLLFHQSQPSEPSQQALQYLQMALQLYVPLVGDCQPVVATVLSNLGRVYFLQANYERALQLFQQCLTIRQLTVMKQIDIATAQFNVGQTLHRLGRLQDAASFYRSFLDLAQRYLGTSHRDFAAGLVLLSDVHRERQDPNTAKMLLEQAVVSGRAALGELHPDLALIYNNLGSLSYEMRQYETALSYYKACVHIQTKFLPTDHPHIVISLLNLAQIYKQKGDYKLAFASYRQVYNIHFDTLGPASMEVATTVSSMALMKYLAKDYQVALNFYQEALRLHREREVSTQDEIKSQEMDIASTLNSIGLVLFKMDYFDMAKDAFLECLNIRKRILGANHRDIAIMWYNLATIYLEKGEDQTAMKLYNESLRVERQALGAKHPEISLTLQHLGQMRQERGELEEAVEYFQEALEIERLCLISQPDNETTKASICKLLNLIGNIHLMVGRVQEMMECFSEACKLANHNGDGLIIAGHNFYGLSRLHPPCAPLA